MSPIEIDIIVRSDAETKGGGDSEQVRQYVKHLGDEFSVRVLPFAPSVEFRKAAIVHVVNVDRPFDFLRAFRLAGTRPVVVSPIHHSLTRIRRMRAAESGRGVRSVVDRILPEPSREWLASGVRGFRGAQTWGDRRAVAGSAMSSLSEIPRLWRRVGTALDRCAAVAVLAEGEAQDLRVDTGWGGLNRVVIPNGRPEGAPFRPWATKSPTLISVGRIEPRKRSMELASAAVELGADLTFVGSLVNPNSRYSQQFLAACGSAPGVRYVGEKPHSEVVEMIASARVLVNASWVEVQSLVDIEAVLAGGRVVSFDNGNSAEWLGQAVHVVHGHDVTRLLEEAGSVARSADGPLPSSYDVDWDGATRMLASVYRSAAGA